MVFFVCVLSLNVDYIFAKLQKLVSILVETHKTFSLRKYDTKMYYNVKNAV